MAEGDTKKFLIKKTADSYDEWDPEFTVKKRLKKTTDPYYRWNPEFTIEKELKRTNKGFPYTFSVLRDVEGTCEDPGYYFRWVPMTEYFSYNDSKTITVEGGVGDFSWSLDVSAIRFSLDNDTTIGRTNTVRTDSLAKIGDVATVTVEDSCGNSVSGELRVCTGDRWIRKANFVGGKRMYGVAAGTDNAIYAGLGYASPNYLNDWWEYSPSTNKWSQKKSFEGVGRYATVAARLGNKIYVGTGYDGTSKLKDWWEYDISSDDWTRKADFYDEIDWSVAVGCGSKVYLGTGVLAGKTKEWWEYDPATDSWTQKTDFGGVARHAAVGVELDGFVYVGLGSDAGSNSRRDWWKYDPGSDNWTQIADYSDGLKFAAALAVNGRIYAGTGIDNYGNYRKYWRSYSPTTNTWIAEVDYGGNRMYGGFAAAINDQVFVGTGYSDISPEGTRKDWWRYLV